MKTIMLGLFLLMMNFSAFASGSTKCTYQMKSCNNFGDHYACVSAVGSFCSQIDMTQETQGKVCADCYGEPSPSKYCKEVCNCSSAFCGAW